MPRVVFEGRQRRQRTTAAAAAAAAKKNERAKNNDGRALKAVARHPKRTWSQKGRERERVSERDERGREKYKNNKN